jgi:hypothetical protein
MPTLKAIHICNSQQPTLHQKLQKSTSLPTLSTERKKVRKHNNVYKK